MIKPFHQKVAGERETKWTHPLDISSVFLSSAVNDPVAQFNILLKFRQESPVLLTNFSHQMLILGLKQIYNQSFKTQVPAVNKNWLILYPLWPHTGHKLQEVHGVIRNAMIRPSYVLKMGHGMLLFCLK